MHLLAGKDIDQIRHGNSRWFEESLCMCGALFALRSLADSWSKADSEFKKRYSGTLARYAERRIRQAETVETLGKWYRNNREELERYPIRHTFNLPASIALLDYFEAHPDAWSTVQYLNRGRHGSHLDSYLKSWHGWTPVEKRPHIAAIATLFDIDVTSDSPAIDE